MKVLVVDNDGVGLCFSARCVAAGHEVRWFVKPKKTNNPEIGKGFKGIHKVDNWVGSVSWADIIVPTGNTDYVERLDFFRKKGAPIFGPSKESADLEIKRSSGMEFLKKYGIAIPNYRTFPSLSEAESFVRRTKQRYVFKTLGDNEDKSLSYVSKSPEDMIARLQRWQRLKLDPKGPVMLQEFVSGVEIGVSRWLGRDGWVGKPNENFEHKNLMASKAGPNTGETGTLLAYVKESKLFDETLGKLEHPLLEMHHTGDIDINFVIPVEGEHKGVPFALEFTCRMGIPAWHIMMALHKGDPVQWMLDALNGQDTLQVDTSIAVGFVIAIPDYPYSHLTGKETSNIPVYGVTRKNEKYIHPVAVGIERMPVQSGSTIVDRPMWATKGDYVAVVTGTGKDVVAARKRALATISEVAIADKIYRDDIGEASERELPELHGLGFATHFNFKGK